MISLKKYNVQRVYEIRENRAISCTVYNVVYLKMTYYDYVYVCKGDQFRPNEFLKSYLEEHCRKKQIWNLVLVKFEKN